VNIRSLLILVLVGGATLTALAGEPAPLPVVDDEPVLATVNGEPIALADYYGELTDLHGGAAEPATKVPRKNPAELLDRLINTELIVQEGINIGLDELPAIRRAVEQRSAEVLRDLLFERQTEHITAPDPEQVERLYRENVKQYVLRAVLMADEQAATEFVAAVRAGTDFDAEVQRLRERGLVQDAHAAKPISKSELLPHVARVVDGLSTGELSDALRVGQAFTVLQLQGVRYPEDPEKRRAVERDVLRIQRIAAIQAYLEELKAKRVKIDQALLDGLDFESPEPGFDRLLTDDRSLATIDGQSPVTVAELAAQLQQRFFHGVERAAAEQKVNAKKAAVFDDLLNRRVVVAEARREELDESRGYRRRLRAYEDSLIFAKFVEKVIDPEIQLDDETLRRLYDAHVGEYTTPEMVRLEAIAFATRADAEDALTKLRDGADFSWIRQNAPGRVDAGTDPRLLELPDSPMVLASLPEAMAKAVQGGTVGDFRFYEDGGLSYVIRVNERIPSSPQPFESIRRELAGRAFGEQRQQRIEEWAKRLRDASEVEILADGQRLTQLLGMGSPGNP